MTMTRRESLAILGGGLTMSCLEELLPLANAKSKETPLIATNTYPWRTFAKRAKQEYARHTDAFLADIARTGINGYEPIIESPVEFKGLNKRLLKHGLTMHSLYVNSILHDTSKADASIKTVLTIGKAARELGTKIIVTNPSPIRWGGPENKTDAQLRFQAKALDQLGAELKALGLTLAYHNHDAELRMGGREFHHMLTSTSPDNVKLCLDSHWIFRGCGDSEVALFDAVAHYHSRVVELHLRQSVKGVWTEAFALQGDIDYARLFRILGEKKITPHLVLEQAVEPKSPNHLSVVEAHRRGHTNLVKAFS